MLGCSRPILAERAQQINTPLEKMLSKIIMALVKEYWTTERYDLWQEGNGVWLCGQEGVLDIVDIGQLASARRGIILPHLLAISGPAALILNGSTAQHTLVSGRVRCLHVSMAFSNPLFAFTSGGNVVPRYDIIFYLLYFTPLIHISSW